MMGDVLRLGIVEVEDKPNIIVSFKSGGELFFEMKSLEAADVLFKQMVKAYECNEET